MIYPTKMEANGHIYPINTDYRVALACFRAINDSEISDIERFYAIEVLLLGEDVFQEDEDVLRDKLAVYLRCGKEENTNQDEIDSDYIQDEEITRTSIRQCYHINLNEMPYLHWYEYNELISGLTSESVLNKIRELRGYDETKIDNPKERDRIHKAKESVALKSKESKYTQEELDIINSIYGNGGDSND